MGQQKNFRHPIEDGVQPQPVPDRDRNEQTPASGCEKRDTVRWRCSTTETLSVTHGVKPKRNAYEQNYRSKNDDRRVRSRHGADGAVQAMINTCVSIVMMKSPCCYCYYWSKKAETCAKSLSLSLSLLAVSSYLVRARLRIVPCPGSATYSSTRVRARKDHS